MNNNLDRTLTLRRRTLLKMVPGLATVVASQPRMVFAQNVISLPPPPKFQGERAAAAVAAAAREGVFQRMLQWTIQNAEREGIPGSVVARVWDDVIRRDIEQARAGTAYDFTDAEGGRLAWATTSHNIGNLLVISTPPMLIAEQAGIPLLLTNQDGSAVNPKSTAGRLIIGLDMLLELLGALLLLLNVVLPKVKWDRLVQAVNSRLDKLPAPAVLIEALATVADDISRGAPLQQILKSAIKVLKLALGSDTIWEVIKEGFDLNWWDWILLAAKFVLLWALEAGADTVAPGTATAAKVALVGATLYEVFANKVPKLAP